jgi:hypothetical protein
VVSEEQIRKWAYDEAPTRILRALSRAWVHAELLPQNAGQYKAGVIEPAIDDAIVDAIKAGVLSSSSS